MKSLEAMQAAPWQYDLFQALRRLECESPHLPRLGHSQRLSEDPVRLGQRPDCAFAPATLIEVQPANDERPARLEQLFFGLVGPNGPLPLHLTEFVRERERHQGDSASKAFFDVFNHRLLSLLYRAWAEARPTVSHDRPDDDYWAMRLAALCGRGQPTLRGHGPLPDHAALHHSGHLAAQTRYPDGLCAILSDYFDVPVSLLEYVGQWLDLPEPTRLGFTCSTLGVDTCLGQQVWDRQHKFRLCIGPLDLPRYRSLLPGGEQFQALCTWVREYLGDELDWDLNLLLEQPQVPPLELEGGLRLGFDTWLGTPDRDADDLLLGRHYATSLASSSPTKDSYHG